MSSTRHLAGPALAPCEAAAHEAGSLPIIRTEPRSLPAVGSDPASELGDAESELVSDHFHPWLDVQGESPFV